MMGKINGSFQGTGGGSLTIKQAVKVYEKLAPEKHTLDDLDHAILDDAVEVLKPEQQFIFLSTDPEYAGIHRRLLDDVHEPKDSGDLMGRLGEYGSNKIAMAMAVQDEEGDWFPTGVVYLFCSDQSELPGHIRSILDAKMTFLDDEPKLFVPYSITSKFPGAGGNLISNAHEFVFVTQGIDDAVLATLSPMRAGKRGLATWMAEQDIRVNGNPNELLEHTFDYLMPISRTGDGAFITKDAVQAFHMAKKGAMLGAIHFGNDDSPSDKELAHGIMANYIYSPDLEIMEQNRQRFREKGLITVSSELAQSIPEQYQDRLYVHQDSDDLDLRTPPPGLDDGYDPNDLSFT